jgi:hypothetical protein
MRQLFGAFSTGIFATILLQREKFHAAVLAQDVTSMNITAVSVLSATQTAMLQRGMSDAAAQLAGISALVNQVNVSATVRSFDDCFWLSTFIAIAGVIPALFLKRGKKAAHHDEVMIME